MIIIKGNKPNTIFKKAISLTQTENRSVYAEFAPFMERSLQEVRLSTFEMRSNYYKKKTNFHLTRSQSNHRSERHTNTPRRRLSLVHCAMPETTLTKIVLSNPHLLQVKMKNVRFSSFITFVVKL